MPKIVLSILNEGISYLPKIKDEITWETSRRGNPGKLTFTVVKDTVTNFQEGNHVTLSVDGKEIFHGFVFTKSRTKEGYISVTAYDQLRYFKNKDTLMIQPGTASDVIRQLAKTYEFTCGEIEETGYALPSKPEQNQTLFDMILHALDDTWMANQGLYILYDDCGKITLKNIDSMRVDYLINQETAENFDYSSSIDGDTYNSIRLIYKNEKEKDPHPFTAVSDYNKERWGLLQYFEELKSPENAQQKADALLKLYNHKTRNLSIKGVLGVIDVRGGSLVPVSLDLGDIVANTYMLVEKVTHKLTEEEHYMDLTLIGGDFSA